MRRIAFVTDSASDLDPAVAQPSGIRVVPLVVTFGSDTYRAGVDLSTAEFWERMTAPDAPFPTTAAVEPGRVQGVFEAAFADGADAIVCVHVAGSLSGTIKSAQIAGTCCPTARSTSSTRRARRWARGSSCFLASELAADGRPGRRDRRRSCEIGPTTSVVRLRSRRSST